MSIIRCLINGEDKCEVPVSDRGLQYGHGVFETILYKSGNLQLWNKHIQRLRLGCERLEIDLPDTHTLYREAKKICDGDDKLILKIIITHGDSNKGYLPDKDAKSRRILYTTAYLQRYQTETPQGIDVALCQQKLAHNRKLAGIKHLNRLEQVLARTEWDGDQYDEGILTDLDDYLISGTMSNVFFVKDKTIITPDLSLCGVNGIVRELVLELAPELGFETNIRKIKLNEISTFSEMFLTNSLIKICPIKSFNGRKFASPGRVTITLINRLINFLKER